MQLKPSVSAQDHTSGNAQAALEIVEYGDYQCPYCGAAHPILQKMMKEFGSQIKFVFRNFPLSEIHEHARDAALAAEAAALQGKFWPMHDIIFENQRHLSPDALTKLAERAGLDLTRFAHDIALPQLADKVDADFESGIRSGVNGTPSFFINGRKFDGGPGDLYNLIVESTAR